MSKIEDAVKLAKILSFLEEYKIENAVVNKDFTVDVDGNVTLWSKGLLEIPIQFGRVEGDFRCSDNNLTSLKGSPRWVKGYFDCRWNKLTTLEGGPRKTIREFYCDHNNLTSLEEAPEYVGGNFYCSDNNLTSLKGCSKIVWGDFYCMFNNLTSLKGIGEVMGKIHSDFYTGHLKYYDGEL